MPRHRTSLLFIYSAGAIGLAEVGAWMLATQFVETPMDGGLAALAGVAILLSTLVLASALTIGAQHLLLRGMEEACAKLETARSRAHVEVLAVAPTLELLGRALRRQNENLGALRDSLLAGVITGGKIGVPASGATLARAAGTAAGLVRSSADTLRLVATLDEWIGAARSRQELVRRLTAELRETLDRLPVPPTKREESDPVFGFGLAEDSPSFDARGWAELPEPLRERLRGFSGRTGPESGDEERN